MSPLPPVFHCSTAPYAGTRACCRRYGGAKTFIDTEKSHSSVTIQLRVARRRNAAHSLIWLKNVQKVCPFAYAPIERHLTLLLTCRLLPMVPYDLLEVCQALLFHTIT